MFLLALVEHKLQEMEDPVVLGPCFSLRGGAWVDSVVVVHILLPWKVQQAVLVVEGVLTHILVRVARLWEVLLF